jgi:hypothetical protein
MAIFTALTKTNKQGTFTSASVALPAEVTSISIKLDMDAVDIRDTTLNLLCGVDESTDDGLNWHTLISASWQGGSPNRQGQFNPPTLTISIPQDGKTRRMRGWLDTTKRISVGATITTTP